MAFYDQKANSTISSSPMTPSTPKVSLGDKSQDFVDFLQVQCHDPQVALEDVPRNLIFTTVFRFKIRAYITNK